ncbi:MAG: homocysteine S-methyltransferase family protein, partial [Planctomycetes bacterium]|nr:homocysteine S-methyltransferase family protein [Planctomycetota bacterium]
DPHIAHAGLIYRTDGQAALERLYRSYLDVGRAFDLPMLTFTPTWRANPERLQAAGFTDGDDVNGDAFRFLSAIRDSYGEYASRVMVGGLMGCAGDAYNPAEALSAEDAVLFHRQQVHALADAGVDLLAAATLPVAGEAVGIARAMAECAIPYLLGFVVRPAGTLLDGTPLSDIVSRIDVEVEPAPLGYMINCVHPRVCMEALRHATGQDASLRGRVLGLQANTSAKSPEELDGLAHLDATESPEEFAEAMLSVHHRFGIKILGGCCGTDDRHIRAIAERIRGQAAR